MRYEVVSDVFARALRDGGHDVEHREYQPGEDLTQYNVVFLGLVPFFSVAGQYVLPAMLCLASAEKAGVPVVAYVDDWRFWQSFNNLRSIRKNPQQLVKPFFDNRALVREARDDLAPFTAIIDRLMDQPWPVTVAPAYRWGDHARLKAMLQSSPDVVLTDPTPYLTKYPQPAQLPVKTRAWVLATASDQRPWLEKHDINWPVHHFGGRASKAPRQLTEAEVVEEYYRHWGVLSPSYGYKVTSTGWWRSRFVFAARAGAILVCDPAEAADLGEPYQAVTGLVEELTDRELSRLAEAQQDALRPWMIVKEQVTLDLEHAVQLAKARLA
jgi:hypothetical protein